SSNAARNARRDELREVILARFAAMDGAQVRARLDRAQIANADMNSMHDVWGHPQRAARGGWTQVGSPAGPIPALKPPGRSDAFEHCMGPVPAVGEHTAAILAELGFAPDALEGDGKIAAAPQLRARPPDSSPP